MTKIERKPCGLCRARMNAGDAMSHPDCFFMWCKTREVSFPGEIEERAAPKNVYRVHTLPAIVPLPKENDPEEIFRVVDLSKLDKNSMRYRYEVLRREKALEAKAAEPPRACSSQTAPAMILTPVSRVVDDFKATMEVGNETVLELGYRVFLHVSSVRLRSEGSDGSTSGSTEGGRVEGRGDREGVDPGCGDYREDLPSDRHQDSGDPCTGSEEGQLSDLPLSRPVRPEDSPAPGIPDGVTGAGDSGCKDEDDDTEVDDDLGHFAMRSILNDPDACHSWPISPYSEDQSFRPDWTVPDLPDS